MEEIKILVVEDEAITAMDIQRRLQKCGYLVPHISDTGADAIRIAKESRPNIILMDIVLKGEMDGTKAAKEISKYCPVPIIFITAYKDEDTFNRAKLTGPYGYITKPFETRDLFNAIELALFKHGAEVRISAAEQRYRSVMENATCGIFIIDKNGLISDLNKQTEKILGAQRHEIIGKNFKNYVHPSERDYADIQIRKLLVEKMIGPNEGHVQQADGNIRDIEFTAVFVENNDEKFIFSILNDVTERNKLRAQHLLADKLATVGTLAAGIIHEINNPMTFILGNLGCIKEQINTLSLEDAAHKALLSKLKDIVDESIHGAELIRVIVRDLKGFTRADPVELASINIHEILDAAINMAYPQFKNHAVLKKDFSSDIPLLLWSGGKLHQVFLNLIINAAQAMEEGVLNENIISISTRIEKGRICIKIADTGKGIKSENLSKIFDPFFTTKPVGIGTGLGLSICYDIIHDLGGEITVVSEIGKGATFSIFLPINLIVKTTPMIAEAVKGVASKKILIIDDEPTLLITLEQILGKDNAITKAQGGRAAFNLLKKRSDQFDVMVTDLNMPDVNGIDLFRYLVGSNPQLAKHTVFTTGGSFTASMTEFISSTKNPCIEKPFTREQLFQAINSVLEVA